MMDFYFQSGELAQDNSNNLISNILQTIAIAGALGAAYYGAYWANKMQHEKEQKSKIALITSKYKFLFHSLSRTYNSINSQLNKFKQYVDEIKADPLILLPLVQVPIDEIARLIHRLNDDNTFDSFIINYTKSEGKVEDYNKLVVLTDFYWNSLSSLVSHINNTQQEIRSKREEFVTIFESYDENLNTLTINLTDTSNATLHDIRLLKDRNFTKEQRSNLQFLFVNHIGLIQEHINLLPANYSLNRDRLIRIYKKMNMKYGEIKELNQSYSEQFEGMIIGYMKVLPDYKSIIDNM